ncbi:amidohydrolase [Sutterella sp.]|uniref:amidohydrolase n=1 Tax=Sutterella sp. TaxID=1981025 RepID=UPI0026DF4F36|nr:amidohydrolase [Sutterella sp.]MDO5532325.1 amidohydrolase [Sutterella sp.]
MTVLEEIKASSAELAEWRHEFHRHPEIGMKEFNTSAKVAGMLRSWGIEVTEKVGVTGVVGVIRGSLGPGRTIGLRSDMDALALTETGCTAWKSENEGFMHACGHDGHMTMLLAAARYLASHRDFRGTVVVVFQPGEEGAGGGLAMINDGLFERFPMDEIYGMHNWTDVPPGHVTVRPGATMAGQDFFAIHVKGRGAHGSAPQLSADTALAAAMIVTSLQQIIARNVAPLEAAVVSITKIHTGSAFNIIPQEAELGGCTRYFSDATGELLRKRIVEVSQSVAASVGCTAEVEFDPIAAVLMNDPKLAEAFLEAAKEVVGEENAKVPDIPQMASEDFSFLARKVPGAYCFLGGQAPYGATNLHNPAFDFDDRQLAVGAALWVTIAMQRLAA